MKILLADDEKPLLTFISRGLTAEGYECVTEQAFHQVVTRVKQEQPAILILDRMFGHDDSITLLDTLKSLTPAPMILLLTAVDDVRERVHGLTAGADDYLCKPFDFDELLARVIALARRVNPPSAGPTHLMQVGALVFDTSSRLVSCDGADIPLTRLEYALLNYLAENVGKVLTRERIISRVWQSQNDPLTNIVDVYISRLRQKLPAAANIEIVTLRGNGYRLLALDN